MFLSNYLFRQRPKFNEHAMDIWSKFCVTIHIQDRILAPCYIYIFFFFSRFLTEDPHLRLGARGAAEVIMDVLFCDE